MASSDATLLHSDFLGNIGSRREEIARQWYLAFASLSSPTLGRTEAIRQFSELAARIIAFLTNSEASDQEAWDIGSTLAEFHCIQPELIDFTGKLWTRQVTELAEPGESARLFARLATLLRGLTSGFFEKSRETILAEQEQIRQALVFHINKVSQELREHQLHLEETIEKRTRELHAKEEQYRLITETSMDGIFQVDPLGSFTFANEAFCKMVGYTRQQLLGQPLRTLIDPDDLDTMQELKKALLSTGAVRGTFGLKHRDGHRIDITTRSVRTQMDDREVFTGFVSDVTVQKRVEDALRISEERYRTLADSAQDLILALDREHQITYINPFAAHYLGTEPERITGLPISAVLRTQSGQAFDPVVDSVIRSGNAVRFEEQFDFPSGLAWLSLSMVSLRDASGMVDSVNIVAKDISDLKRSEQALLLAKGELEERVNERTASLTASQQRSRDLARQVITAQEEERRRLARELHDQSGQALVSIKYEINSIYRDLPKDSKLPRRRVRKVLTSIDQTIQQIREISQDLRPPILDVAGINLSLKEYCAQLAEKTSLSIEYEGSELPGLDAEIGISLFRIVQELLTNVLKHAHATAVTVDLRQADGAIALSVQDNGTGLKKTTSKEGLGLLGIQERLDILGGSLVVTSKKRDGTKVVVSIPWKQQAE